MPSLVGSRVERKEDKRLLTGKGRYTADINIANQTYAVFIRSPHARAKIKKIDTSKALKSSGVAGVLTGEDIAKDKIGEAPFSVDSNLLHTSSEGKVLENPAEEAPDYVYQRTTDLLENLKERRLLNKFKMRAL